MQLSGLAGTCFFTTWFEGKLSVDGENYEIGMYSVPNDAIGYDIILGRTLFQTDAVLKVSPHAVTITHVDTTRELMNISASIDELDISMRAFATKVLELVNAYRPVQGIVAPMKTVIVLKDEVPVYQRPRRLAGAVVFSTLDLRNGFFHVPVDEPSVKYTSFVVPSGQYEFLRTPFGLYISPPVFQRYVNFIFRDLIRLGYLLAYMDDLIVMAENVDEGLERLEVVLHVAAVNGLDIKWSKFQFLKDSINYLGYRIRHNEVSPSETKTIAVQKFPLPRTIKAVQSFLGLTGYFHRFIGGYSQIALPLSDLLK